MQVWQTSNLRRLRLGEEKKKDRKKKKSQDEMEMKWSVLFRRAIIMLDYPHGHVTSLNVDLDTLLLEFMSINFRYYS